MSNDDVFSIVRSYLSGGFEDQNQKLVSIIQNCPNEQKILIDEYVEQHWINMLNAISNDNYESIAIPTNDLHSKQLRPFSLGNIPIITQEHEIYNLYDDYDRSNKPLIEEMGDNIPENIDISSISQYIKFSKLVIRTIQWDRSVSISAHTIQDKLLAKIGILWSIKNKQNTLPSEIDATTSTSNLFLYTIDDILYSATVKNIKSSWDANKTNIDVEMPLERMNPDLFKEKIKRVLQELYTPPYNDPVQETAKMKNHISKSVDEFLQNVEEMVQQDVYFPIYYWSYIHSYYNSELYNLIRIFWFDLKELCFWELEAYDEYP